MNYLYTGFGRVNRAVRLCFLLLLLSAPFTLAQLSEGGEPYSFTHRMTDNIDAVSMPPVDVAAFLAEDAIEETQGVPFRFGAPIDVTYSLQNSGTWEDLADGGRIWRFSIKSSGASSLNFLYSDYWLPDGATLYLYNKDHSEVLGAFTDKNNKESGVFATAIIRDDEVTLEYYEPASVSAPGRITISRVVHGYKDVFKDFPFWEDFGGSGSCNINVNCPDGANWQDEKRSVAMILSGGGFRLCSGSMINNANQDFAPIFLTANHCLGGEESWIFMFNYESPSCENIDGPLTYTLQGSTLLASNADSDFGLLLISETPPDDYNIFWAGWTRLDVSSTNSVGIHHPEGDIKKISFDNDPCVSDTYLSGGGVTGSHWRITDWDLGTTEPGSSGSPLYNENHHIIGQLHGGYAACGNNESDWYGKFSMSWDRGSSPNTRLKDWLDPSNTGLLYLDGTDPSMMNPDNTPPTPITNLAISSVSSNSLTITWTAPGDTSNGGVRAYDIRYSTSPIPDTNAFKSATPVGYNGVPHPEGESETIEIGSLPFSQLFYVAIRSRDRYSNWSALSNVPSGSTWAAPVMLVTPAQIEHVMIPMTELRDTIWVKNTNTNPSTLNYNVELLNNTFPGDVSVRRIPDFSNIPVIENNPKYKDTERVIYGQSIEGTGGPDDFGYSYIDSDEPNGPAYVWEDISAIGTEITGWSPTGDDGRVGPIDMGINFKYYGEVKTQVYVSANGFISFVPIDGSYFSNSPLPSAELPNNIIAGFWDDLDGRTSGSVYYYSDGTKFIIQFDAWPEYSGSGTKTFQIVLYPGSKIMFYYKDMTGINNEATVGIENSDGTIGLSAVYDADYVHNLMAVKFAAEPDWVAMTNFSGTLNANTRVGLELLFRSEDYPFGDYSMDVRVTGNAPANPEDIVPVHLLISQEIPVELLSFTAEAVRSNVNLAWSTATETNNAGFTIERRMNNTESWESVGYIAGSGTTTDRKQYSFIDKNVPMGKYAYRLRQADFDGTVSLSQEIEVDMSVPTEFTLLQNYPNPFNPSTTITYSLPERARVTLEIYNMLGEVVATLVNEVQELGYYSAVFNAAQFTSGTYFYRLRAQGTSTNYVETKKMVFLK